MSAIDTSVSAMLDMLAVNSARITAVIRKTISDIISYGTSAYGTTRQGSSGDNVRYYYIMVKLCASAEVA